MLVKGSAGEGFEDEGESEDGEGEREARGGGVDAEEFEAGGHGPVEERSFFEVADAVGVEGDPVVAEEHLAGDFGVDGVGVVEEWGGDEGEAGVEEEPEGDEDEAVALDCGLGGGDLQLASVGWVRRGCRAWTSEEVFDAGVVEGDAVDAAEDGVELEVEIGIGGECAGKVGLQGWFASDASGVVAEDFYDEGRVEGYVVGVVLEDAIEVVAVPRLDPGFGKIGGGLFGHDHGFPLGKRWFGFCFCVKRDPRL